jgi:hypothetical protein
MTMQFLDKLLGRAPAPSPIAVLPDRSSTVVQQLVVPPRAVVNTPALDAAGLRRGMWVISCMGLAILTGARLDGLAEITLQKADGMTMMELDATDKAVPAVRIIAMNQMRAAHIEEIPDTRHEGADHLRSFGYISASEVA